MTPLTSFFFFFFFNDTATTEIYTLSLHDALPILLPEAADRRSVLAGAGPAPADPPGCRRSREPRRLDRNPDRHHTQQQIILAACHLLLGGRGRSFAGGRLPAPHRSAISLAQSGLWQLR